MSQFNKKLKEILL